MRKERAKATGRYRNRPAVQALSEFGNAESNVARLEGNLRSGESRKAKRGWRADLDKWGPSSQRRPGRPPS